MKIPPDPESTSGAATDHHSGDSRVIMMGVNIALVAVWALTEPFYELSGWILQNRPLPSDCQKPGVPG